MGVGKGREGKGSWALLGWSEEGSGKQGSQIALALRLPT